MIKKNLSRKKFIAVTLAGIAGFKTSLSRPGSQVPDPVNFRALGRTGIKVSPICFGASRTNEESLIRYTLDKGINFIDTGRSYGNGTNEKLVGRAISGRRNKVVIQSKQRLDPDGLKYGGKGKRGSDEIREILTSGLDASLKALGTDYIDILLYHDAIDENLLFHPEVLKFFGDAKSSGIIKAHGFSAHNEYLNLHERNNREVLYDVIMLPFNHKGSFVHSVTGRFSEWNQNRLLSVLTEAGNKSIGIIAMKTCSGGKYSPGNGIDPDFKEAVRWVIGHSFVSSAAIAMANFEQVNEHVLLLKST